MLPKLLADDIGQLEYWAVSESPTPFNTLVEDRIKSGRQFARDLSTPERSVSSTAVQKWIDNNRWPKQIIADICAAIGAELMMPPVGLEVQLRVNGTVGRYKVSGWIDQKD